MERVKTGIAGFDNLLGGGLPRGSTTLIAGRTGTGKTILCMEYLYRGAMKFDQPGIYLSLSEDPKDVAERMNDEFGFDFEPLVKQKKIMLVKTELYNFEHLISSIEDSVNQIRAQRLVIDPISVLALYFEKPMDVRKSLLDLQVLLRKLGCTSLLATDVLTIEGTELEKSVAENVVSLDYAEEGGDVFSRTINVANMRATGFDREPHPLEITKKGIVVYYEDDVF